MTFLEMVADSQRNADQQYAYDSLSGPVWFGRNQSGGFVRFYKSPTGVEEQALSIVDILESKFRKRDLLDIAAATS